MKFFILTLIFVAIAIFYYCLFTFAFACLFDFTWVQVRVFPFSIFFIGCISLILSGVAVDEISDCSHLKF